MRASRFRIIDRAMAHDKDIEPLSPQELRQMFRHAADMLASALPEADRGEFLTAATTRINRAVPPPQRSEMRAYLKAHVVI